MTSTLLLEESKASTIDRSGDKTMRPGEPPALISAARASVSYSPLMTRRPGAEVALATLCDASTRAVSGDGDEPPQDIKLKLATTRTADERVTRLKRQAPNRRKNRDLSAKYGIIAEAIAPLPSPS
jgi:hypothetical protein